MNNNTAYRLRCVFYMESSKIAPHVEKNKKLLFCWMKLYGRRLIWQMPQKTYKKRKNDIEKTSEIIDISIVCQ